MAVGQGKGTTIQFESGFFAKVRTISTSGKGCDMIDLTSMDTSWDSNVPSQILKAGEVSITMLFDPSMPPPLGIQATMTMIFPDGHGFACLATLYDVGEEIPYDKEMIGTYKCKFSGEPTWS